MAISYMRNSWRNHITESIDEIDFTHQSHVGLSSRDFFTGLCLEFYNVTNDLIISKSIDMV